MSTYRNQIKQRGKLRFLVGILARIRNSVIYGFNRFVARSKGATVGRLTNVPLRLALKANRNLIIGDNCSVQTSNLDLRIPLKIGNNVIIGNNVEIITLSHNIDSVDWEHKYYGLEIEDFVWLATKVLILPSCRKIGYGAVVGAGSVVVKEIEDMSVVGGNPAVVIKARKVVHRDLIVESLMGGDLIAYVTARI